MRPFLSSLVSLAGLSAAAAIFLFLGQPAAHGQYFAVDRFTTGRSPIRVDQNNIAWVAGTDANVVTLVHLGMGKALTSFTEPQPTAVASGLSVVSASEKSVTLFNPDSLQILSKFGLTATPLDYLDAFCTCGNSVVQSVLYGYEVVATYSRS